MPAVNLPRQRTHGNVALSPVPGGQLRLLLNIGLISLGLICLGVLRFVLETRRRRYKALPRSALGKGDPGGTTLQRLWTSEKSSGISNQNQIMSSHQESGIARLGADQDPSDGRQEHIEDGSRQQEDRGSVQDETAPPLSSDTGTLLILKPGPLLPPPLTPPTLSTGVFPFQDRRLSFAASNMGLSDLDTSFFHQPNPDYTLSPSSESTSTALPHGQESSSVPRRRSYTRVLPLGLAHSASEHDGASFSPSSFPSSSPILPLAPHESLESREIDVQGEIISVVDDSGAGWKRHTRVYGGGVCLACLASGSQGGFYGENVPPEHRR
ncbi:hypothetical protein GGS23DRAFT_400828 [Durotheca rogersii]|uniref:uncharacterized protein n=1 Tax=Durotheca rogersii TaxID=419775 RepID=UPI00221F6B23|nr:uncharacterized protein GGS23DRAFT_400828 [Durotheca rogersii]KAI5856209.1 hypothetical protein GGS23DRAFT_400828 [Durotheca rogersii]